MADRSPRITPVKGRREGGGGQNWGAHDDTRPSSTGNVRCRDRPGDGQGCEDHPLIHRPRLEPPVYGPRPAQACRLDPDKAYLQERITAYPQLSGRRLLREVRDLGYDGGYTAITDFLRTVRPPATLPFEVRFETPPGRQAQVDFAQFQVIFADDPEVTRIVWLFSLVLGSSRWLWARFVLHQDLQTVLRCHIAAFADLGGVPEEIL